MKKVGKMEFEAVCPLCKTIWNLYAEDIYFKEKGEEIKPYINCKVCERGIWINTEDKKMFRTVYHYTKE